MTSIEWVRGDDGAAGETWNPIRAHLKAEPKVVHFCVPVHDGCKLCYASRIVERWGGPAYAAQHRDRVEFFLDEKTLLAPLSWKKPKRIFPCSMTDLYGPWVLDAWLDKIKAVQALTPQHTYIELTKRPGRMREYLRSTAQEHADDRRTDIVAAAYDLSGRERPNGQRWASDAEVCSISKRWPLPNVWSGPSCSSQRDADEFIPLVLDTPIAKRIVSLEPLLGPIDLRGHALGFSAGNPGRCVCGHGHGFTRCPNTGVVSQTCHKCDCREFRRVPGDGLHWVIIGGESGKSARPCELAWVRSLIRQCRAAGVPCFLKQLGTHPLEDGKLRKLRRDKKKGTDWSEWPADLRVREFPRSEHAAAPARPVQLDIFA